MTRSQELDNPVWWDARYHAADAPWDRGIVAPEVIDFAQAHPGAGRWALDIGCGTGTHSRELARNGYRVAALDLSSVALQRALGAARAESLSWVCAQASAAHLDLFAVDFALALDVGCFHGLQPDDQIRYAAALSRRLAADGCYLLYAVHPRTGGEGGPPGVWPARIIELFGVHFDLEWRNQGRQGERRADWWLWRNRQT